MQSSSKLFPVALVSAELRGDLTEDVYLLKPNNSPDPSVELALTRLGSAAGARRGEPLVLLHGAFGNRRSWYTTRGHGLGSWLARAGFDVWLAEMRGHGLAPRNRMYRHNGVADYARFDLPAIAAFVTEQCGQPAHWLGHSLGGLSVAAALAGGHLPVAQLASLVLLDCQVRHLHWSLKLPPLNWGARLLLCRREQVAGGWLGFGPEDEPAGIARAALRWYGLFGRFGEGGEDWASALAQVQLPVLALAGSGDRSATLACGRFVECFGSPRRAFLSFAGGDGLGENCQDADLLAGRSASREVWPLLEHWLRHGELPSSSFAAAHTLA